METIISTWCAMVSKAISLEERLNLKVYRPTFTNKLSNVETSQCHDTCCALRSIFANTTSCLKVKFTDKCAYDLTTHERNVLALAKENQYLTMAIECNPPHMMLWAGVTSTHDWSLFFDGNINSVSYAEMLEVQLMPQFRYR
jgi:hypothetical protein